MEQVCVCARASSVCVTDAIDIALCVTHGEWDNHARVHARVCVCVCACV